MNHLPAMVYRNPTVSVRYEAMDSPDPRQLGQSRWANGKGRKRHSGEERERSRTSKVKKQQHKELKG